MSRYGSRFFTWVSTDPSMAMKCTSRSAEALARISAEILGPRLAGGPRSRMLLSGARNGLEARPSR